MRSLFLTSFVVILFFFIPVHAYSQVHSYLEISDKQGGFTGILDEDDRFGMSVKSLGDLDQDGITDLVVGAPKDDDNGEG